MITTTNGIFAINRCGRRSSAAIRRASRSRSGDEQLWEPWLYAPSIAPSPRPALFARVGCLTGRGIGAVCGACFDPRASRGRRAGDEARPRAARGVDPRYGEHAGGVGAPGIGSGIPGARTARVRGAPAGGRLFLGLRASEAALRPTFIADPLPVP